MLAIQTAVIPASNTKPTRIKAFTCNGHRLICSRDDSLGDVQQHLAVAQRLIREQLKYAPDPETMVYGGSERGYVFCFPVSTITLVSNPRRFRTEDGFVFFERPNGQIVDHADRDRVDMVYTNFEEFHAATGGAFEVIK